MLFLQYTISTDDENRRIDRVLRKFLKDDLALSQIYKSLRNGEIRVNNKKVKQKCLRFVSLPESKRRTVTTYLTQREEQRDCST